MQLHLVDLNPRLVDAWREAFAGEPDVSVHRDDILRVARDTIVAAGNSHGLMDGGLDLVYVEFFGNSLQERVLRAVEARSEKMIPVGEAILVKTGHPTIPRMILAPTMESPGPVEPVNSFFAMLAALRVAGESRIPIEKLFCPGLATGTGRVPPHAAAAEMFKAYHEWRQARS